MSMQATLQLAGYEETLNSIMRTLPVERVAEVMDFAQFVQSRTRADSDALDADETEEEIRADNARWDATFAASQDALARLARETLAQVHAGRTTPMVFTADGRIAPG